MASTFYQRSLALKSGESKGTASNLFGRKNWEDVKMQINPFTNKQNSNKRHQFQHSGKFSAEEDSVLIKAVQKMGKNWAMISKTYMPTRTARSIRERYMNYLASQF